MIPRRISEWLLCVCVVVAGCATMTSAAHASLGLKSFAASFNGAPPAGSPPDTLGAPDFQAGSHPYQFTASFAFDTTTNSHGEAIPEESAREVQIELPRGLVGNPVAMPQCPLVAFASGGLLGNGGCPVDTQVGIITLDTPTLDVTLPIFDLVPPAGVAAEFGVNGFGPVVLELAISSANDYSLTVAMHDVSQALPTTGASITLWGVPAESGHDPFRGQCLKSNGTTEGSCPSGAPVEPLLTMPTSCGEPLTTKITVDSWENPDTPVVKSATADGAGGVPSGLLGCDRLHFSPTVSVQPESSAADTPTGLTVDVRIPYQNEPGGLAEANLKALSIALPVGLSINPATASGLAGCSAAQIGLGEASEPTCPQASKIGVAELESPMLAKTLQGSIYIAEPAAGQFDGVVTVYVAGAADGVSFKLSAQLSPQSGSDQLTFTVDNLPEFPLSDMRFDLFGGPRAAIATPLACGTFTTTADLTPYSAPESGPPDVLASSFAIDEGCAGGFTPSFEAGATSSGAGQSTAFSLRLARADGQRYIQSFAASLPPGLLADLSAISVCAEAEAAAGTCPAASEMGTIAVGAGAGGDPYYLDGRVYLTGPYDGAPYGLSMVIPASAGPFNLGTVVVRGEVTLDFSTARVTITAGPLPTAMQGVTLRIKSVILTVDRPGLMINPTDCAQQTIGGIVGSAEGASVAVSAPFRVVGCSRLPFAPMLTAAVEAPASRAEGVGLDLKVAYPKGVEANMSSMSVVLPRRLRARLTTIQQTCRAEEFTADPALCPPDARVGRATGRSSLLPAPLTGSIYLVTSSGLLPRLAMTLQGDGVTIGLDGAIRISGSGVSSAVFEGIPDVPLSSLEIALPRGPHSALGSSIDVCTHRPTVGYTITAHNGARVKHTTKLAVLRGCGRGRPGDLHNRGDKHGKS
jgi:hypothetical protein